MRTLKGIGVGLVVIVVVAAIVLLGWLAGWWFKQQNVEKESDVFRDSYANQERLREDALDNISEIQGLEVKVAELPSSSSLREQLEAQKMAIVRITCNDIAQINDPEETLQAYDIQYC